MLLGCLMKRKTFFLIITACVLVLQSVSASRRMAEQRGNDLTHIQAAQEIDNIVGVEAASVITRNDCVLVGITLFKGADKKDVGNRAKQIVLKNFSASENCKIFVGNKKAEDVIELSLYIDSDMDKKILEKRFDYIQGATMHVAPVEN